jgi:hypothetical protein
MFLNGGETDKQAVVQGIIDGFKNAGFLYFQPTALNQPKQN